MVPSTKLRVKRKINVETLIKALVDSYERSVQSQVEKLKSTNTKYHEEWLGVILKV